MTNFTLYTTTAFIILDADGARVMAKYYRPSGAPVDAKMGTGAHGLSGKSLKEQRAFEKGLWEKTKKAGGDIILYDGHLSVYKHITDLIVYIIGNPDENELMLHSALVAFSDALHVLLRGQVERRAVLENFDLVMLCLDETIDDGVIVETDSVTIASRVSRPRADPTDIVLNEQTLMNAYQTVKERMQQRIQQL